MYNETTKNKIRRYAESARTALVFGHGVHTTERKFVVERDQAIVFLAPIGVKLSVRSITKRFYEIFSNSQRIKEYVTEKLPAVPQFMKGWQTRTYGPGTLCPDLWLEFSDQNWPSMGIVPLPLRAQLRAYSPKIATSLVHLVGSTKVYAKLPLSGAKTWMSAATKGVKGLVFVIACRSVKGGNDATTRMAAHEKAQKMLKRKRAPASENQASKKQKTKNQKLEDAEKRKQLLARLEALKQKIRVRR
jgi:hypothetical protein